MLLMVRLHYTHTAQLLSTYNFLYMKQCTVGSFPRGSYKIHVKCNLRVNRQPASDGLSPLFDLCFIQAHRADEINKLIILRS